VAQWHGAAVRPSASLKSVRGRGRRPPAPTASLCSVAHIARLETDRGLRLKRELQRRGMKPRNPRRNHYVGHGLRIVPADLCHGATRAIRAITASGSGRVVTEPANSTSTFATATRLPKMIRAKIFPDWKRAAALVAARELLADNVKSGTDNPLKAVIITDESGQELMTISANDILPRRPKRRPI
jgi:hypothetical protein